MSAAPGSQKLDGPSLAERQIRRARPGRRVRLGHPRHALAELGIERIPDVAEHDRAALDDDAHVVDAVGAGQGARVLDVVAIVAVRCDPRGEDRVAVAAVADVVALEVVLGDGRRPRRSRRTPRRCPRARRGCGPRSRRWRRCPRRCRRGPGPRDRCRGPPAADRRCVRSVPRTAAGGDVERRAVLERRRRRPESRTRLFTCRRPVASSAAPSASASSTSRTVRRRRHHRRSWPRRSVRRRRTLRE